VNEYLVELTTRIPEGTPQAEVARRRAAERERAAELAATGHLYRLWRPVGELRSIGIWCAEDEAELREKVLGTLPLSPWMTMHITPLEPHPNDPGRASGR
jgi:muconolactone D-isomerase